MTLVETIKGEEIEGRTKFDDTDDVNVKKMGYFGVAVGVGNGMSAPNDLLTREMVATFLTRLSNVLGHPFPDSA